MFGDFIRETRIKNGIGLREFCLTHRHDPSNWSKLERGILPPPADKAVLERWAQQLRIEKGSNDWQTLFDLASVTRGELPDYIKSDAALLQELPVFFRTLSGQKPNKLELKRLANLMRGTKKKGNARP